jgi:hypothetical protein
MGNVALTSCVCSTDTSAPAVVDEYHHPRSSNLFVGHKHKHKRGIKPTLRRRNHNRVEATTEGTTSGPASQITCTISPRAGSAVKVGQSASPHQPLPIDTSRVLSTPPDNGEPSTSIPRSASLTVLSLLLESNRDHRPGTTTTGDSPKSSTTPDPSQTDHDTIEHSPPPPNRPQLPIIHPSLSPKQTLPGRPYIVNANMIVHPNESASASLLMNKSKPSGVERGTLRDSEHL